MAKGKVNAPATVPRLTIPTLIGGEWDTVIIWTYGADLAFLEEDLWRQLERTRNRVVFADARQMRRYLWIHRDRRLRHVNRSYVLAPVAIDHACHAKLVMLLRHDAGLLLVGSGNLSYDGYASQGECFTTYRWSDSDGGSLGSFLAVREFIDEALSRQVTDPLVNGRVAQAWADAPWLFGAAADSSVRHNLKRSLLDHLMGAIGDDEVAELTIHAPFYDARCEALRELIRRARPRLLRVLLQEAVTSVDSKRLARVLSAAAAVDVRSAQADERGTFLHAKFVLAKLGDRAVCLQGSPNISTPALLRVHPEGNIEVANLLVGPEGAFDHLVGALRLSEHPVDVWSLHLQLVAEGEDADEDTPAAEIAVELAWVPPRLSGRFACMVTAPPALLVAGRQVDDVSWQLDEPQHKSTGFVATLGPTGRALLERVESVAFDFGDGIAFGPQYPFHLNALAALASGQARADLLRQAGDFAVDDEELEQLLVQLDEVLVVDGRSVWRMLRRPVPETPDDSDGPRLSYEDLDWNAIQSHPKLAQYRSWDTSKTADATGLGILLGSIAERFRREVSLRTRSPLTEPPPGTEIDLDDLSSTSEAESEDDVEDETQRQRHRLSARARARRLFHNFVRRFVNGITDEEFVRLVGPSVIIPSYVVFNHICWKLAQLDLADRIALLDAQLALWRFFWGEGDQAGYLASLTVPEQEAALELLDRHHAEAVLLAAVFQAYDIAWREAEDQLGPLRSFWRQILVHDLWQPSAEALSDAAAVAGLGPDAMPTEELVDELDGLAHYYSDNDPRLVIAAALGTHASSVYETEGRVTRGVLGEQTVDIYVVSDPKVTLTPAAAALALSELARLRTDASYLRLAHPESETVAFADFDTDTYVWASAKTGDFEDLELSIDGGSPWEAGLEVLRGLAA